MDQERRSQRSNLPRSATSPTRSPGCGKSGTWSFSEVWLFFLFKEMHAMSLVDINTRISNSISIFWNLEAYLLICFCRVFVGTVSEFCVKHAECPVITIKRRADETPQDPVDD